jgi:hypothetical protein
MMIFAEHKATIYQALKKLDSAYYYKNIQLIYADSRQKASKTEELLCQQWYQEEIRVLELQQKEPELIAKHRELSMLTLLVSNKN